MYDYISIKNENNYATILKFKNSDNLIVLNN